MDNLVEYLETSIERKRLRVDFWRQKYRDALNQNYEPLTTAVRKQLIEELRSLETMLKDLLSTTLRHTACALNEMGVNYTLSNGLFYINE